MTKLESAGEYLTTGEVAEITGWTRQKVRMLCETQKLPAIDTSTTDRPRWTIRRVDLDRFLTPSSLLESAVDLISGAFEGGGGPTEIHH